MKSDLSIQTSDTKGVFQLVTLHPDKIIEIWEKLVPIIEETYSVEIEKIGEGIIQDIYKELLAGFIKAYIFTKDTIPIVFMIASKARIPGGLLTFFIHALYSFEPVTLKLWYNMLEQVKQRAQKDSCSFISAKTPNLRLIKLVESFGGDTSYRYITLEV